MVKGRCMHHYFLLFLLALSLLVSNRSYAVDVQEKKGTVLLAILARNKAHILKEYLERIENLDYDKKLISVYINTNNNCDQTKEILLEWIEKNKSFYANVDFESVEVNNLAPTNPHDWNADRLHALSIIRNKSLQKTREFNCNYYFVVDCDNFIAPYTLKSLITHDKPIIAPMLRSVPEKNDPSSNFFCAVSPNGYYESHPDYYPILNRLKVGVFKVPVVHCTYLINADYLDRLTYVDGTQDYEFLIFSRTARANCVDQYICNDQDYGTQLHFFGNPTLAEEAARFKIYKAQQCFASLAEYSKRKKHEVSGTSHCDKTILVGIIIHNYDHLLSHFLRSLEKLDYDKKLMQLQFDVCASGEEVSKKILDWMAQHRLEYRSIDMKIRGDEVAGKSVTERNRILALIKDGYLAQSQAAKYDYCFILSSDVFLLPRTLNVLVEKNKPIIAPLLRSVPELTDPFRNFFADVTENGYYKHHADYDQIANRHTFGTFKVPCVHAAYLIDTKEVDKLNFSNHFRDWEFLSFSRNARDHGVEQFICNEKEFGVFLHFPKELTLEEERIATFAGADVEVTPTLLSSLLKEYYADDPLLKAYAADFAFSDYALYAIKDRDLFYVDDMKDYIKHYFIKKGLNWEEHILAEYKKYVKPGSIVIDIGGHIGTHALNLSRLVGDAGMVYVFEPQVKMFCELAINMHLNRCTNVKMFHNALGAQEKWIEMAIPDEAWKKCFGDDLVNEGHGVVRELSPNLHADRAKMIRLDDLNLNNVSFIKIDVEGSEREVIEGAMATIKRNKPVMVVEIFQNQDRARTMQMIENLGYVGLNMSSNDFIFIPSPSSTIAEAHTKVSPL